MLPKGVCTSRSGKARHLGRLAAFWSFLSTFRLSPSLDQPSAPSYPADYMTEGSIDL